MSHTAFSNQPVFDITEPLEVFTKHTLVIGPSLCVCICFAERAVCCPESEDILEGALFLTQQPPFSINF